MTLKEELEAQGKRLADAQKRYFASLPQTENEREVHDGDRRPGIVKPDRIAFGGTSSDEGTSMSTPRIIQHYGRERLKYIRSGEGQYKSTSGIPPNSAADVKTVQEGEPGFTLIVTIGANKSLEPNPQPPVNAEFILHLLLRQDEHDALIGDLIERYGKKCARLGARRANLWFYAEILWTALPLLKRALFKTSGIVAFGEWVRRHVL
jgi:hypothetical protein